MFHLWFRIAVELTCHCLPIILYLLVRCLLTTQFNHILTRLRSTWKTNLLFRSSNFCPRVVKIEGLLLLDIWFHLIARILNLVLWFRPVLTNLLLVAGNFLLSRSKLIELKLLRLRLYCYWLSFFVDESFFYLFLGHYMRERHVVYSQLKMLSIFRQIDSMLAKRKSIRK